MLFSVCRGFHVRPRTKPQVRGHGGSLYFEDTIVTSWDTPNGKPQEEFEGGRSFLNCVSEKLSTDTCEGTAKNDAGECRMDIIDSEIAYLGYFDAESYGMTWKVRKQQSPSLLRSASLISTISK